MKTPYFIIHKNLLDKNINDFKNALNSLWKNSYLGYSVKTNSLPWLLEYINNKNGYAEVVSDEEYQLAKLCGYDDKNIIFNGPIKSDRQLMIAIEKGAVINIDSKNDLRFVLDGKIKNIENIGIRVNINPSVFRLEDIGYEEDGFRFGFSKENGCLLEVIQLIKRVHGENVRFGLHLHCNSVTRSLDVYRAIASYASDIIKEYHLNPSFIDIGGGFFGGVEGKPSASDYVSIIKEELSKAVNPQKTKLIIEPGSAIIGSAVDLYTSVIDVKDTSRSRIVTTDGSRIHIDPLWKKSRYMYSINTENNKKMDRQIICGYTCMDHDRMMVLDNAIELSIGDKIIYHRVGAYSMTFGGPFIRYFPDVYVKNAENTKHVRERMSVENYYRMHTTFNKDKGIESYEER